MTFVGQSRAWIPKVQNELRKRVDLEMCHLERENNKTPQHLSRYPSDGDMGDDRARQKPTNGGYRMHNDIGRGSHTCIWSP